ncbi:hypothetical protein HY948_05215, partial [Candidatus Gottesmanbacteria bacterium]|nr:hypothetical protein [Candidatus Gottesmanbacteria bacterium]
MIPIIHAIIRSIHKRLRQTAPLQFIIVLIAVVATVGVVKYFGKKGEWRTIKVQVVGRNWTNAFTNYEGYRPPYWLAEHVRINDLERGINGSITASVQRVETYSRGSSDFDMYLTLSINGIRNTKTGTLSYNGKII